MSLSGPIIAFLVLYFVIIIALSMMKTSYVPGRAICLLRALFPSWRFFEDLCEVPRLYYRAAEGENAFGPWEPCFQPIERRLSSVFLNPEGNLLMAYNSLLHQLQNDIQNVNEDNPDEFIDSVSYKLTNNLVLHHLSQRMLLKDEMRYQFKVSSVLQGADKASVDLLTSAVHEV